MKDDDPPEIKKRQIDKLLQESSGVEWLNASDNLQVH